MGNLLTTKELAKYLKLTKETIYKYAHEGKIPGAKIASRWRFDKDRIDDLWKSAEGIKYESSLKDTSIRE